MAPDPNIEYGVLSLILNPGLGTGGGELCLIYMLERVD